MAAGFKFAQINASLVPSTQTNFPSYVDLSRLGITTLAEAESVRVYADSAKTTEWARECVSATEMHVKVPSLTSTVEMYVDYDGVRADYSAGDTYGRNAVWSDYLLVWHMNDLTTSSVADSTGNGWTGTKLAANTPLEVDGIIGKGQQTDDQYIVTAAGSGLNRSGTNPFSIQAIYNIKNVGTTVQSNPIVAINSGINSGTRDKQITLLRNSSAPLYQITHQVFDGASKAVITNYTLDTVNHSVLTFQTGTNNLKAYTNGTNVGNGTATGSFNHGANSRLQTIYSSGAANIDEAIVDEIRYRGSVLSANWITTEYNNQSNESSFWGTWTDAGGATPSRGGILLAW
jgi:hypothetical protein